MNYELHFTDANSVYGQLNNLIAPYICGSFEILRNENGKPYIDGNPVYFSLSHSGGRAVIAVSHRPVGVDMELFKPRKHETILSRFTKAEKAEIADDYNKFLINWTAKEAFVKMLGGSLFTYFKRLEYVGGVMYLDNTPQNCDICARQYDFGIVTAAVLR